MEKLIAVAGGLALLCAVGCAPFEKLPEETSPVSEAPAPAEQKPPEGEPPADEQPVVEAIPPMPPEPPAAVEMPKEPPALVPEPVRPARKPGSRAGQRRVRRTYRTVQAVCTQIELFRWDHNRYPTSLADLRSRPAFVDPILWTSPYYDGTAKDAWDRELGIKFPGPAGLAYEVKSLGEDGAPGGEGFARDLTNHD